MSSCGWSRHRPDGVGLTALATWASPSVRRRRSVHRSVEMAPRCRFGAFVYTVGPWPWVVGGLGIATVYTNGRIGPLDAVLGHLCTLLRLARIVRATVGTRRSVHRSAKTASRSRFGALVYTVATRALRCELRRVVRAPQPPWRAGGAPLAGRFSLGREDRLCASGAAVRLASSPRQQPTQIPDEPGSSGLYEGREGRPPREGPVTLDLLTRWPRHLVPIQSGA